MINRTENILHTVTCNTSIIGSGGLLERNSVVKVLDSTTAWEIIIHSVVDATVFRAAWSIVLGERVAVFCWLWI